MKKNLYVVVFLLFALLSSAWTQERTITGTITSAADGTPLPGVTVLVVGTSKGVITDLNGKYSIAVPSSATSLRFSFIGMETKEIPIGNQNEISLTLDEATTAMEEVVVTSLGIKKEAKSIGYSVQRVGGDVISESKEPNVVNTLVGRVAGVQITQGTGVGTGTSQIIIRGANNFTADRDNQPLIIVDGVPIDNTVEAAGVSSGRDWGSGLNALNSEDIAEMTVLKGPNAAALYGARAANGAIIITTKSGKRGAHQGIGVNYSYTHRFDEVMKSREVQNDYGASYVTYWDDSYTRDGDGNLKAPYVSYWGSGASWGPKMDGRYVKWYDKKWRPFTPQPDNLDQLFEVGQTSQHNLSFSGGNEKANFRASVTNWSQTAIVPNVNYDKFTVNFNGSVNLSDKVRADLSATYYNIDNHNPPSLGDTQSNIGKNLLYNWTRSEKLWLRLQNYKNPDGSRNSDYREGRAGNYVWGLYENNTYRDDDRFIGSLAVTWQITPWLGLMGRLSMDKNFSDRETRNNPWDVEKLQGYYWHGYLERSITQPEFLFTFDKQISDKFSLTGNFGGSRYYRRQYYINGNGTKGGFAFPGLFSFSNSKDKRNPASESLNEKAINSLYGSVDIGFNDYLYLSLTGRNDWSSTLPQNSNSYFYPSVSLSYVFSDMFDLSGTAISSGKVRGSWAKSSVDENPYQLTPTYSIGTFFNYPYSSVKSTLPPVALKPQDTYAWEVGTDLSFWNYRLSLNFTYYNKISKNQILSGPLPITSGFSAKKYNSGSMKNNGVELTVTGVPVLKNNFKWEVILNYYRNKSEVVELDDEGGVEVLRLGGIWGAYGPSIEVHKGEAFGTIYGWKNLTDDQGRILVASRETDKNWAGIPGYYITGKKVPVGNITPKFIGGLNNVFTYKNITLTALMDVKWGGDMWMGSVGSAMGMGQAVESLKWRDAEHGGLYYYIDQEGVRTQLNSPDEVPSWEDDEGNPITPRVYDNGAIYSEGVIVKTWQEDADGNPVLDDNGDPIPDETEPNTILVEGRRIHQWLSSGWGPSPSDGSIVETSWIRMTELSLAYTFPKNWINKAFLQNLSLAATVRNAFFIYNNAPMNLDPSGSTSAGHVNGIEFGSLPTRRQIALTVRVGF